MKYYFSFYRKNVGYKNQHDLYINSFVDHYINPSGFKSQFIMPVKDIYVV